MYPSSVLFLFISFPLLSIAQDPPFLRNEKISRVSLKYFYRLDQYFCIFAQPSDYNNIHNIHKRDIVLPSPEEYLFHLYFSLIIRNLNKQSIPNPFYG